MRCTNRHNQAIGKDIHVEKKTFEKDIHTQCALNSSKVTTASFPDYSKAFDTIRYNYLNSSFKDIINITNKV